MAEKIIGVEELAATLAPVLRQVEEGASFAVTSQGRAVARIVPPRPAVRRVSGTLRGQIGPDASFDALPAGFDLQAEGKR